MTQGPAAALGLPPSGKHKSSKPTAGQPLKQKTTNEFPDIMNRSLTQIPLGSLQRKNSNQALVSARKRDDDGISELEMKSAKND